jgi:acetyltransferase-like isoleucine patch superfamily enzyme
MGILTHIVAHEKVEIGDNVLMASKCFISDTNHWQLQRRRAGQPCACAKSAKADTRPVKIGANVLDRGKRGDPGG